MDTALLSFLWIGPRTPLQPLVKSYSCQAEWEISSAHSSATDHALSLSTSASMWRTVGVDAFCPPCIILLMKLSISSFSWKGFGVLFLLIICLFFHSFFYRIIRAFVLCLWKPLCLFLHKGLKPTVSAKSWKHAYFWFVVFLCFSLLLICLCLCSLSPFNSLRILSTAMQPFPSASFFIVPRLESRFRKFHFLIY